MLRKFVRQLNPIQENKVAPVNKIPKCFKGSRQTFKDVW